MQLSLGDYANVFREYFWLVVAVGVAFSFLTLLLGQVLFRRKRVKPTEPKPEAEVPKPPEKPKKPPEKRGFIRRTGNVVPIFWTDSPGETNVRRGSVIDRSAGGLCLLFDHPVEVGKVLRVRPCSAVDAAPWVEVHVKSCRKEEGQWELGCQFVTIPGFNVLLLFG